MSLLQQIQSDLLDTEKELAPILLKFKFLASRLNSSPLEKWIMYELEGYPEGTDLPPYRIFEVVYRATFSGPFGAGIQNAPIPPYLISQHAGESWTNYEMRQSIAAVDELARSGSSGSLHINASNLILLLQGKVYEGYACNDVTGTVSISQLTELKMPSERGCWI
ncbi:hypothetical protein [Sphingomicrobium aquimarinum]|uniref:AbiTii domain-containing protein n=1 Tax=Sphingomicrobium aquimarinum TaxID=3133971 RepID=UPI003D749ECA